MNPRYNTSTRQRGVTSIFVVIFAALLFSIMTLSFAGMMSREQRRASDDELSQSAYDSALAGVEDAKRVILVSRQDNSAGIQARAAIEDGRCNTVAAAGITGDPAAKEILIQSSTSGSGSQLNQAYTCVIIGMTSADYKLEIDKGVSEIVPLQAEKKFDRIVLNWHRPEVDSTGASSLTPPCVADWLDADPATLCTESTWKPTSPALLRAQVVNPGPSLTYDELNDNPAGNTVFAYPTSIGSGNVDMGGLDRFYDDYSPTARSANHPERAICTPTLLTSGYTCEISLQLAQDVPAGSKLALLRLTPLYAGASISVTLYDGTDRVNFDGAQPRVDSTGRANDLFRRVEARLSLAADYAYPEAAVDLNGPLCKDFFVTTTTAGWFNAVQCNP